MFRKTKLYTVLLKKNSPKPLETAIFVPQGFNIWAVVFFSLWALFNRLWVLFIFLFAFEMTMQFMFFQESVAGHNISIDLAIIALHIWFGIEANDLRVATLERKGYIVFDITSGMDEVEAERRFFDKYQLANQLVNVPAPNQENSELRNSHYPESDINSLNSA